MKAKTINEEETIAEALQVLMKHLPPSKFARVLSLWRVGSGDYTKHRPRLFPGKSVDDLYEDMVELEKRGNKR